MQKLMKVSPIQTARLRVVRTGLVFATVCGLVSCDPPAQPGADLTDLPDLPVGSSFPFVVSNPTARLSSLSLAGAESVASDSVVYVSLPPGAIAGGLTASIRNTRTGNSISATMADGGFDPVAVTGIERDSLSIVVISADPPATGSYGFRIPKKKPPKVVRTDPPPQKRDVPLNYNVLVVFSEPIDPASLTTSSVKLRKGTTAISGRVAFSDAEHIRATFTSDAPLEPATEYVIEVTQEVRDEDGDLLEASVIVSFTTRVAPVASVIVQQETASLVVGDAMQMVATLRDSAGNALTGRVVTWSSSNEPVATISPTGLVVAVAPGTATIVATAEGKEGTAIISAIPAPPFNFVPAPSTLVTGATHGCALNADGEAFCWGNNNLGQLGNGRLTWTATPTRVAGGLRFTMLAAGWASTCGLTVVGEAYCWGSNWLGQLGHLSPTGSVSLGPDACPMEETTACSVRPVAVAGGHSFTSIVVGYDHTCALTATGQAFCWGWGGNGELGAAVGACRTGSTQPCSAIPVLADAGRPFQAMALGYEHTCGLRQGGAVFCWGHEHDGQLGVGENPYFGAHEARAVAGGLLFQSISAHWNSTCGVTVGGSAYCWGNNDEGHLGDGTTQHRFQPAAVAGGITFGSVGVGGYHSCGLSLNGAAYCWGWNGDGELGNGSLVTSGTPVLVAGGLTFASLTVGDWHACGQTSAGVVYCWGYNGRGELGNGTFTDSFVPVPSLTSAGAASALLSRRRPQSP